MKQEKQLRQAEAIQEARASRIEVLTSAGESLDLARKTVVAVVAGVKRIAEFGATGAAVAGAGGMWLLLTEQDRQVLGGVVTGAITEYLYLRDYAPDFVPGTALPGLGAADVAWRSYLGEAEGAMRAATPFALTAAAAGTVDAVLGGLSLAADTYQAFLDRRHIRGARRVSHDKLIELVYTRPAAKPNERLSPFKLAGVPITWSACLQVLALTGSMGSGKSVQVKQLVAQAGNEGIDRVVLCVAGDYISEYHDPDNPNSLIVHPYDKRSVAINLFDELSAPLRGDMRRNCENFFSTLLPDNPKNQFWVELSRLVAIETTMAVYEQKGGAAVTKDFFDALNLPIAEFARLHANSPLASNLDDRRALDNVRSVILGLKAQLRALQLLSAGGRRFSLAKWAQGLAKPLDEREPYTIFLATTTDTLGESRMLLTALLDVVIRKLMSLPVHRHAPRVLLALDEFQKLGNVTTIPTLMTEGRKFGVMTVLAFQALSQLETNYDTSPAMTLLANMQTLLAFRTAGDVAQVASDVFGEEEFKESSRSMTSTAADDRDSTGQNQGITSRPVVLASEITYQDDLYGFLKLPGNMPVAQIKVSFEGLLDMKQPGMVPKAGFEAVAESVAKEVTKRQETQAALAQKAEAALPKLELIEVI